MVTACNALAASGTWEQITPPTVLAQLPGPSSAPYGTNAFVLDPTNYATVYLGTSGMGIWKTTDCGATWVHINTGTHGAELDTGRNWTMQIDPTNPKVIYTNEGYGGSGNGAFKSTNGGVDWTPIWPPADPSQANIVQYNFVNTITMDPANPQHLLLAFHATCSAPYTTNCIAESSDGGGTWKVINGDPSWNSEGWQGFFLNDSKTFLLASSGDGVWTTNDDGATWKKIEDSSQGEHNGNQIYRATDGTFYFGATGGVLRSPDGVAWTLIPNSGQLILGLASSGQTIYASSGYPYNPGQGPPPYEPVYTSAETDGMKWVQMTSPLLSNGGPLGYDPDHHILYSSNWGAGFYRVVTQ
jgi:hypothetical protein